MYENTMHTNKMMRLASCLLILVLLTTSMISGTFAKYVTTVGSEDSARVAYWGFQSSNSMDITGIFADTYQNVDSVNGDDVIAPGTEGSTTFAFAWDEAVSADGAAVSVTGPEVAYTFDVDTTGSECAQTIQDNANIQWKLDDGSWGTWQQLMDSIEALSGDASGSKDYAPNTLPNDFTASDDVHTISWQWIYTTSAEADVVDTAMGNADALADVKVVINITATQID